MNRFIIVLFLLCSSTAFAQSVTQVAGVVKDISGNPLPTVGVAVLKATDSSLVKTDITEPDGRFELAVPAGGNYLLRYTLTNYITNWSPVFTVATGTTYHASAVALNREETKLKEVTFAAKKPMIEVRADKTIFNVENSINATGSNALELLQKSPGVVVDNNENISMKGKNGVKVYIDGRMTQLDSKELAAYLKNISSNDIESIEMISNPSAKYDASGNAGIINFRLKKNKKYGTNGSANLTLTQGVTPKANGSVSLNYRNKKVNVFGNVGGSQGRRDGSLDLDRLQNDTNYIQRTTHKTDNRSMNVKAGIDYFISSRQTLGFLATSNVSDNISYGTSYTNINTLEGDFIKKLTAYNNVPGSRTNNNLNLNYKYADTSGHELNIDADYGLFRGRSNGWQPNYYTGINNVPIDTVANKTYTPTNIDIFTMKADWEQRMGKGTLGLGVKVSYVKTDNTLNFYTVLNDLPVLVTSRSNRFRYLENVNAAYMNYNTSLGKKWSLQAGLRMENTMSRGELTRADGVAQPDDSVVRDYTDLFPSAALTYTLNKNNSLNLTYSRRIDRPSYQDLNPFENKLDELTYQKGNAFLRPQFTNTVELTHTFMGFLNTTVGYSRVHDFSTEVTDTTGSNASYVQERNIASQQILSLNIGSGLQFAKWWTGYVNLWGNYQYFEGQIDNKTVTLEIPSYGAYLMQNFDLGKNYSVEVSGWYNGPSVWGLTWLSKPLGALDLGAQKQFWNKNATIKISATDIFKTSGFVSHSDFGGMVVTGRGRGETQTVRLSFSYRFGSSQVANARQRHTGLESESGRIK